MSALDDSKAFMSHTRHYRVLPRTTGPLTLLESIAEVPDWEVAKMGKLQHVRPRPETQLSMCLFTVKAKDEDGNNQGRVI